MPEKTSELEAIRQLLADAESDNARLSLENHELRHRIKNVIATIQAITNVSLRIADGFDEFRSSLSERLRSLADCHALLGQYQGRGADFRKMLQCELDHYDHGQVSLAGDDVMIPLDLTTVVSMAFHELATNAVKYGALSVVTGTISVSWRRHDNLLTINWVERGGPPTRWPTRRGFGSELFKKVVIGIAHADVEARFTPLGLEADIALPLC